MPPPAAMPLCRASKQAKYLMECRTSAAQSRNPTFIKWHPETMKSNLCLVIEKLLIVDDEYKLRGLITFRDITKVWIACNGSICYGYIYLYYFNLVHIITRVYI